MLINYIPLKGSWQIIPKKVAKQSMHGYEDGFKNLLT